MGVLDALYIDAAGVSNLTFPDPSEDHKPMNAFETPEPDELLPSGDARGTAQSPIFARRQGYRPLVAFDFDGTLTRRDSFLAFLKWHIGPARYAAIMASLAPATIKWVVDRDRGRLKAAVVSKFLRGIERETLARRARDFATEESQALLRPDALRCWKQWQAQGARLVIVTASPEILIAPFAHGLGADHLIATRLAFDDHDCLTGALVGNNCRGLEKVRRLQALFGSDLRLEAAYGDSAGDHEMLAIAEESGLKVFGA